MFPTRYALIRGCRCLVCGRRIVRQKDQESFGARSNACSITQTSKRLDEEADAYAITDCFCETKEGFADSLPDAEEQVKTQENVSYSNTGRIAVRDRNSVC